MKKIFVAMLLGTLFVSAGIVKAEPWQEELKVGKQADQLEASCAAELESYCKDVKPGEGRLLACLNSHKESLSPKCESARVETSRLSQNIPQDLNWFAAACLEDIEKLCTASAIDPVSISKCLDDHKDQLSTKCDELRRQRGQSK